MVRLTRGNKGIIEIMNIKDSNNRTEDAQKEHRAHPGVPPGCGALCRHSWISFADVFLQGFLEGIRRILFFTEIHRHSNMT